MTEAVAPLKAAKANLRKAVQATLRGLSDTEVTDQSAKVQKRLFAMPEYQQARSIGVYLSMPAAEVQTRPIVLHALRHGKKVFVPYLYKNASTGPRSLMDMVGLRSEGDLQSLQPDRWGIPSIDTQSVPQRARCLVAQFEVEKEQQILPGPRQLLDLIVMPGVAFDRTRHRLGHGKGYYDIFLSHYRELRQSDSENLRMPYLVGLALDEQILPEDQAVPIDASDWMLDALIAADSNVP